MLLAATFAAAGVVGLLVITLRLLSALPNWFGPAVGFLISLALLCVFVAFYVSNEPAPTKSGRIITKESDPLAYRVNFILMFCLAGIGILYFAIPLVAALRAHA
jgi:hypothetical protein